MQVAIVVYMHVDRTNLVVAVLVRDGTGNGVRGAKGDPIISFNPKVLRNSWMSYLSGFQEISIHVKSIYPSH